MKLPPKIIQIALAPLALIAGVCIAAVMFICRPADMVHALQSLLAEHEAKLRAKDFAAHLFYYATLITVISVFIHMFTC